MTFLPVLEWPSPFQYRSLSQKVRQVNARSGAPHPGTRPNGGHDQLRPPSPHRSASITFHGIPFAKISTPAMTDFTRFFPKQFHRKFFSELSPKIFPAHAMNARFVIFQKCRIAPFARFLHPIPTSFSRPGKPERKTGLPLLSTCYKPIRQTIAFSKVPSAHFSDPSVPRIHPNRAHDTVFKNKGACFSRAGSPSQGSLKEK